MRRPGEMEMRYLLRRAHIALRFYANERNWAEDDWGILAVVQGKAYGDPTAKAAAVYRTIDKFLRREGDKA